MQYPTTLARRASATNADESYVLYSNALKAGLTPPVSVFTIAKVKF